MLSKLDRYILRKYFSHFFFMLAAISLFGGVIDFSEKLADFIDAKDASSWEIFTHYWINFVIFLADKLAPICVFLGVILFTSSMTQKSEIVAILSSGVSFYRVIRTYILGAVLLTVTSFVFKAYIVPRTTAEFEDFYWNKIRNQDVMDDQHIHRKVNESDFIYLFSFNQYNFEGRQFELEQFSGGRMVKKTVAPRIVYNDTTQQWRIHNPVERYFTENGQKVIRRPSYDTTLYLKPADIYKPSNYSESLTLPEVEQRIIEEQERGGDFVRPLQYERQERYAFPFAMIILTVIGFGLSTKKRRGGIALQIGLGIVLAFAYIILLTLSKTVFGEQMPIWLATWLPNIIFICLAAYIVYKAPK